MPARPPLYIRCTAPGTPIPNQAGQNGHCFCAPGNDPFCCFCTQRRSTLRYVDPLVSYDIETSGTIGEIDRSTNPYWRQDNVEPGARQSRPYTTTPPSDFGAYFNAAQNIFTYRPRTEGDNTPPNVVYYNYTGSNVISANDPTTSPPEVQGDFDDDGSFELKD